jgi:KAP family P-loop domain
VSEEHTSESVAASTSKADGEERPSFAFEAWACSDLPAEEDLLGFSPLVEGLRALLSVRRTQLPLSIAITAPWGAGKSSVMLQLRNLLRDPGERMPQERKWWTVDFPAWKYEQGERLWAALAKAVYEQPQRHMSIPRRIAFRVKVERERLGWYRFLLKGLWPPIAAIAAVSVSTAAHLSSDSSAPSSAALAALAAFIVGAGHYWGVASMPFKRAIERYASAPDYDEKLGFTADADRDIRSLARVLAPDTPENPYALAVFVDDLDRCASPHVVEVVEAMNQIFNSDARHGCVFVLGIDREIVATGIEVAYEPTVSALGKVEPSLGESFGMHFLDKLVQISVTVPRPPPAALERLMGSIVGAPTQVEVVEPDDEEVVAVEEAIRRETPERLAQVERVVASADASAETKSVLGRRLRASLLQNTPEVADAEFKLLRTLGSNPREIKRFDNAFRLQLYVAIEDPECRLEFSPEEFVTLGRWVALRLRWPGFAKAIDDRPELLLALEATANDSEIAIPANELDDLRETYGRWFGSADLLAFLVDEEAPQSRRVSTLEPGSFLRIV